MLIEVSEASQAGNARRKATLFAEDLKLTANQCSDVALVATEMATNLVKHAGRGHILIQSIPRNGHTGLRLMSVDKGPGITDISRAFSDGPVGSGTLGSGLGTIKRVPDFFDLYSVPGAGTVVSAEFWHSQKGKAFAHNAQVGVISEPINGEEVSGDGWGARCAAGGSLLMVVDGLGHGVLASEAAREAEGVFFAAKSNSLKNILQDSHDALRKTRGAALALAHINYEKGLLTFAGVGNVSATIVGKSANRSMASYNGTVGHEMQRVQEFTYPWDPENILVMHSDGMASRWDLERYPGIRSKSPSVIAAVLHRDFYRGRDDVTVLVAKSAQ